MSRNEPAAPGAALPLLGFLACAFALIAVVEKTQGGEGSATVLALAWAGWALEYTSTERKPVDFSTGFVFYLALALMGNALAAMVVLAGGYCVRSLARKNRVWDLVWLSPTIVGLLVVQVSNGWPLGGVEKLVACALSVVLAAACFYAGSSLMTRRLTASRQREAARIETSQRALRAYLLLCAPMAAALPPSLGWLMVLTAPLCYATQRAARNIGFRVHAQEAVFMRDEVEQSRQEMSDLRKRLEDVSERQRVLEELTAVFSRNLTPAEAFAELARVASIVGEYRTIAFFRAEAGGQLKLEHSRGPEVEVLRMSQRNLHFNDAVFKGAWNKDSARRGSAPKETSQRLLPTEGEVLVIPLKPLGLLYLGKGDVEFGKGESGRLLYVVKRAGPALSRADQEAARSQLLEQTTQYSERLEERVALMRQLLGAVQRIVAAVKAEQVYTVLEELLKSSVPHLYGAILLDTQLELRVGWGLEVSRVHVLKRVGQEALNRNAPVHLESMAPDSTWSPHEQTRSMLVVPLQSEQEVQGVLVVGCGEGQELSQEEHDFLCTAAYLAGAGLTSLSLYSRLESAHQQVVQASKLSAVGRLAASVAHELNTPLAAIGLAIEAASIRPEKAAPKLERANQALNRARDIVKGLLDHARHSGSERTVISLDNAFEGVRDLLVPQLVKRRIQLQCEQGASDGILANLTDLQQVLINLIMNAADASEPESQVLLSGQQNGATITIKVEDRGTGIAQEDMERLFEPFFTTKPAGKGTGLGLSVCKELVGRHQGVLKVESELGKGTVVQIDFPARRQ